MGIVTETERAVLIAGGLQEEGSDPAKERQYDKPQKTDQEQTVWDDPWKHRSSGMRCHTCMWFMPKGSKRSTLLTVGRCRRHAPTMNGYPVVYDIDWCGDHKLNEETL